MTTKSAFSVVGLAHKVCLAAEAQGYTPALLNTLAEHPSLLGELRKVQMGLSEIKPLTHAIDCDADPFLPNENWKVEEHHKDGVIVWDSTKASLYLSRGQKGDKYIIGNDLRKELAKKPTMNANILDYLLKNPHLIPEDWKKDDRGNTRHIFFWGTIYRNSDDYRCVRHLYWFVGAWDWSYYCLDGGLFGNDPAALRAS